LDRRRSARARLEAFPDVVFTFSNGAFGKPGEHLIDRLSYAPALSWESIMTPEEEDKVVEALEELRINYNMRQWRVCSLICDSLAEKFRTIANKEQQVEIGPR
jgi:hypothetical protein